MKTSQQLEIERYERTAKMWAKRKARWAAHKASKIEPNRFVVVDFRKGTIIDLPK